MDGLILKGYYPHIVLAQGPRRLNFLTLGMATEKRSPLVWDYDISESDFQAMLDGKLARGRLGQDWAAIRLLEYGHYRNIIHLLGYRRLVEGWPTWRNHIRSESRKRGFDFLVTWLPQHHPELLTG